MHLHVGSGRKWVMIISIHYLLPFILCYKGSISLGAARFKVCDGSPHVYNILKVKYTESYYV
jgi:hypothetical protein